MYSSCRNWSDNTVVFVETLRTVHLVDEDSSFALSIYRHVCSGTSFTALPVVLAENAAFGLHDIQSQVEDHTVLSMSLYVGVGQAVQTEDVALLPVLVDFGKSQLSSCFC